MDAAANVRDAANSDAGAHVPMSPQDAVNLEKRVDVDIDPCKEETDDPQNGVILSEAKDPITDEVPHHSPPPGAGESSPKSRAGTTRRKPGKKDPITPEEAAKRKKRTRRTAIRLTLKILIYPVIAYLILTLVIGIYQIHDNDMFPSLRDGDLVITYKLVEGYFTGDVVIYEAEGKTHVGRICAVAGDEVYIMEDGYYELNGSIPHEDIYYPTRPGRGLSYPYKVQADEVFILGDMRLQATDSRALGAISIKQLKGKVVLLLFRGRGF